MNFEENNTNFKYHIYCIIGKLYGSNFQVALSVLFYIFIV